MQSRRRLVTGTLTLAVGAGLLALLLIAGLQVVLAVSISTDFMQCANDDSPYPLGDCHWIGSILQANNSVYLEGMSVPQRAIFDGIPATTGNVHTLGISHQATKGGIHAYDFLTSWDQAIAAAPTGFEFNDLHGQACWDEIGNTPDFATICSQLHGPGGYSFDVPLPGDPFTSKDGSTQARLNAYEALYGPRTIRIYSNAPITGASVSLGHSVTDGNDSGDSYIDYTLTYTSTGTQLLVELAGHLSVTGDFPANQLAWGPNLGASQIQGGPYHFNLGNLDGISLGNQDNQIKGADILIVPGQLIVDKVTDPAASPQLFDFDLSTGTGDPVDAFSLADQDPPYQILLNPGTYSVTETVPAGWDLTNVICSDQSDPSAIGLDAGETVTCTFYNTLQRGTIIVEKQTDPDGDTTSFTFTGDAAGSISDGQQIVVSGLLPGTYTSQETVPAGWNLTSIICDDANSSGDLGTATATFDLGPGETVTCTFTDTLQRGTIIVEKQTDPDGDTTSFTFTGDAAGSISDGQQIVVSGLLPGTYTSQETVPAGWNLTSIICDDANSSGDLGTATATFDLGPGETVTCTFTDTLQRGTIIVEKQTDPDGDTTSFTFTGDAAGSISDGQQIVVSGLLPGTYTSQETVPAGWDLTSIICNDTNSSGDLGTATATFDLGPGETVTCTFTDTQRGTIIVEKQTDPDGDTTSFTFTGDAAGSISDGQQIVVSALLPGIYTSQETVPAGWNLTSIICDDANSSGDLGTATATFDLGPGETVTCTFTDTLQRGTIIVEKQTDPDGDTTSFTFTGDAAGSISDGQQIVVSGLLPGTYTSQETVPAGWDLTSIICDDANSSGDLGTATATFDLGPGETVTCTFTDTQRGAIIVRKVTDPSPDPSNASFGFTAGGGLSPIGFSLGDGDSQSFDNLLPRSGYSAAETNIPPGWSLASATCDDGSPVNNIDVAPGETVTCTFTNTATPACIEIEKTGDECSHPGEEVSYHFWVHNCGDFDLENVTVTDPLWDPDLVEVVGTLAADDGAAGGPDEYSFDAQYTVPAVFNGALMPNTATAEGTDVVGRAVSDQDGHVVEILDPCIGVTKTHLASSRPGGEFFWGDKVTYKIRVENCSADTTLYNVKVVDQWESPYAGVRKSWPTIASLAPGETRFFSYIYSTKKADGAAIVNKAIVTGDDGCELVVTDEDFDEIPLGQPPDGFVPEWDSILLLASGLGPLAAYARMRLRKRA